MLLVSDIFNAEAIAAYYTEDASNKRPFLGEAYFPNRRKAGLDLSWIRSHKGAGISLMPSTFDAMPTLRPRGQAQITREEMPFFRESRLVKERDLIELSRIADMNDPFLENVIDSMYDDTTELLEGAEIAAERMRMNLLAPTDGNVVISIGTADNVIGAYNYDADGSWKTGNYIELTASDTWDNPTTATPFSDITTAVRKLAAKGVVATTIIGTSNTFNMLCSNEQVKAALVSVTGQALNYIDDATVQDVIKRKLGLEWISYDKIYRDYDGTEKAFYPDGYVTILGDSILGNTWRGTTPEELAGRGGLITMPSIPADVKVTDSGIAIAVMSEYKPSVAVTTTVSQIVLPSYEGMNGVICMKVTA